MIRKRLVFQHHMEILYLKKDEYYTKIRRLLERYDAISLREENGVDYLKNIMELMQHRSSNQL